MAETLLVLAAVSAGLYAGLFGAFQSVVMPSLAKLDDREFVAAMRSINRTILNPVFYAVFLGSVVWPAVALFFVDGADGKILTAVALAFNLVSHGITASRNVPLNNRLDAARTGTDEEYGAVRSAFERPWNRLHAVRTLFNLAGFVLLVVACLDA